MAGAEETERTIRRLQLSQLFRSSCHPLTNAASTTLAVALRGGDHASVIATLSLASTVSSALELVVAPFIGKVADRWGRKPLLIVCAMLRFLPYVMNAFKPSMLAIFMEAATDSVAFSIYTLGEQCLIADLVTDAKQLAVATSRATSSMGVAQVAANLVGGTIAAMNPRLPFVLGAAACDSSISGAN